MSTLSQSGFPAAEMRIEKFTDVLQHAWQFSTRMASAMRAQPVGMPHCNMRSESSVRACFERAG